MTCPLCVELLDLHQRAVEYWVETGSELAKADKDHRWRVYRAHASACGGAAEFDQAMEAVKETLDSESSTIRDTVRGGGK